MITVNLTTTRMSEMDEDIKSVAKKLTYAYKEESDGKKENS